MDSSNPINTELFKGLKALSASTFPKQCPNCGAIYRSEEEFWKKTESVFGKSGLKKSLDENDAYIVELFRNCQCGSTLMDCFNDRRDTSEEGLQRRATFGKLLGMLEEKGLTDQTARTELLKLLRGQSSQLLNKLGVKTRIL